MWYDILYYKPIGSHVMPPVLYQGSESGTRHATMELLQLILGQILAAVAYFSKSIKQMVL